MKLLACLTLLLAAFALPARAQAPTHPDLAYATLGAQPLKLDLYLPSGGTPPYPLWISIHGGGWSGGSKFPLPGLSSQALQQGFAVASLQYRLSSQAVQFAPFPVTFPAQIHDIKGAIRWLRANAASYQLDAARFGAFGTSAGGHLAALLATSGGVAALEGDVGGNLGFSSSVQAAIDFFGPTDVLNMNPDVTTPPGSGIDHDAPASPESRLVGWSAAGQGIGDIRAHLLDPTAPYPALVALCNQINPVSWVDASDPPMFIGHGTHDTSVPINQSTRLSAALFAAGVAHDFRAVPLAGHGLGGAINPLAIAFMQEKLLGPVVPEAGSAYCAGDGSASSCPCGNASFAGANQGCRHSLLVGANLNAVGTASIASDSLLLRADSMPNTPMIFLQGSAAAGADAGAVFGDGLLCVGGTIRRLGAKLNTLGWSSYPLPGDPPVSVKGGASPGVTLHYQAWFRDGAAYCSGGTWNLSNALALTWGP